MEKKNEKLNNAVKYIRWFFTILFLIVIWREAHWSVALAISSISFSIEGIFLVFNLWERRIKSDEYKLELLDRKINAFIKGINEQAEALKKEMDICHECEEHGQEGIRLGGIHNKYASNCLLNYARNKEKET